MRHQALQIATVWSGLLAASFAWAQFQTSLQVNTRVNTGLYPTTMNESTIRYGSQNAQNNPQLPSQNRFDIMQSGLLPSQIRAGQMAAGPLAPGGITAALDPTSALQQATQRQSAPSGPLAANMSAPQSSIRYSSMSIPAPSAQSWQVPSNQVPSSQIPSSQIPSSQVPSGAVPASPAY